MKKISIVLLTLSSLWIVKAQAAEYILQHNGKCDEKSTGTSINFDQSQANDDWQDFISTIAVPLNIGNTETVGLEYNGIKVTKKNWGIYGPEILFDEKAKICVLTSSSRKQKSN